MNALAQFPVIQILCDDCGRTVEEVSDPKTLEIYFNRHYVWCDDCYQKRIDEE